METLITVWILGAVMTAFMSALFVMVRTSDVNNRTTQADSELRRYAEVIRALPYIECGSAAAYKTALGSYTTPTGVTPDITSLKFWIKANGLGSAPVASHPNCPASDDGVQQLDLKVVVSGNPAVSASTRIDKRDNRVGP